MSTSKLTPGSVFPSITVVDEHHTRRELASSNNQKAWNMIVIYRGKHCPICTKYLNKLAGFKARLDSMNIDLIAVSADSQEQLEAHQQDLALNYPLAFGLTLEQMQTLGLYISTPRSEQETDHLFAEPALFIVNDEGKLHVVDIANNPMVRPDLEQLVSGLEFLKNPDNNYPIRGTFTE